MTCVCVCVNVSNGWIICPAAAAPFPTVTPTRVNMWSAGAWIHVNILSHGLNNNERLISFTALSQTRTRIAPTSFSYNHGINWTHFKRHGVSRRSSATAESLASFVAVLHHFPRNDVTLHWYKLVTVKNFCNFAIILRVIVGVASRR